MKTYLAGIFAAAALLIDNPKLEVIDTRGTTLGTNWDNNWGPLTATNYSVMLFDSKGNNWFHMNWPNGLEKVGIDPTNVVILTKYRPVISRTNGELGYIINFTRE